MNKAITVLLVLVGIINFLPVIGVLSASNINQAYSVEMTPSPNTVIVRGR